MMSRGDTGATVAALRPAFDRIGRGAGIVKLPLSLFVAYSALFGFLLAGEPRSGSGSAVFCGILLLACGAGAVNNVQDRVADRRMQRTCLRPLATGSCSPGGVGAAAAVLVCCGLLLVGTGTGSMAPALVGGVAMVLYNGVYTPLKKRSGWRFWALLPGAACGALPPYIGWLAAGGSFADVQIFAASAVLFLWQVPHFWLILMMHRSDYTVDVYAGNGRTIEVKRLHVLVLLWIMAMISVVISLLVIRGHDPPWIIPVVLVCSLALPAFFVYECWVRSVVRYRALFQAMNCYLLGVMSMFALAAVGC